MELHYNGDTNTGGVAFDVASKTMLMMLKMSGTSDSQHSLMFALGGREQVMI